MIITFALAWWHGPAIATVVAMLWLLWLWCWPVDDDGLLGGLDRVFMAIPALAVTAIVWIVGAVVLAC